MFSGEWLEAFCVMISLHRSILMKSVEKKDFIVD
jgi:hypothetical protein